MRITATSVLKHLREFVDDRQNPWRPPGGGQSGAGIKFPKTRLKRRDDDENEAWGFEVHSKDPLEWTVWKSQRQFFPTDVITYATDIGGLLWWLEDMSGDGEPTTLALDDDRSDPKPDEDEVALLKEWATDPTWAGHRIKFVVWG